MFVAQQARSFSSTYSCQYCTCSAMLFPHQCATIRYAIHVCMFMLMIYYMSGRIVREDWRDVEPSSKSRLHGLIYGRNLSKAEPRIKSTEENSCLANPEIAHRRSISFRTPLPSAQRACRVYLHAALQGHKKYSCIRPWHSDVHHLKSYGTSTG